MPCVLRAVGSEFEPDEFLRDSDLDADPVYRRGDPKFSSLPEGAKWSASGFHVGVSDADFHDLAGQIRDTLDFLREHEAELQRLVSFQGVECVVLDFGIARRDVAVQSDAFPPVLLALAGRLNLHIELSQYPISSEESGETKVE